MSITFALVAQFPHRLVYTATRVNAGGVLTGTITNTGAATPDLLTDAPATTPLGSLLREAAASQAAARAILSEGTRAQIRITPRTTGGSVTVWACDAINANVLSSVIVSWSNDAAAGADGDVALLEIEFLYINHQWPPI